MYTTFLRAGIPPLFLRKDVFVGLLHHSTVALFFGGGKPYTNSICLNGRSNSLNAVENGWRMDRRSNQVARFTTNKTTTLPHCEPTLLFFSCCSASIAFASCQAPLCRSTNEPFFLLPCLRQVVPCMAKKFFSIFAQCCSPPIGPLPTRASIGPWIGSPFVLVLGDVPRTGCFFFPCTCDMHQSRDKHHARERAANMTPLLKSTDGHSVRARGHGERKSKENSPRGRVPCQEDKSETLFRPGRHVFTGCIRTQHAIPSNMPLLPHVSHCATSPQPLAGQAAKTWRALCFDPWRLCLPALCSARRAVRPTCQVVSVKIESSPRSVTHLSGFFSAS